VYSSAPGGNILKAAGFASVTPLTGIDKADFRYIIAATLLPANKE
jgi:hypothetical protein